MGNIIPTGDNVVIEAITEEVSASGIIIPDSASKDKPVKGKVLAVGPGKLNADGSRSEMEVKEGDTVIFSKYSPNEIKLDGKEVLILSADSIYAKIA